MIKKELAQIIGVNENEIDLERIEQGLSHPTFKCVVSKDKYYFVKVYPPVEDLVSLLKGIESNCDEMRKRGIPTPELIYHHPRYPQVVVHKYVDGEAFSDRSADIRVITDLYRKILEVGFGYSRKISKEQYITELDKYLSRLEGLADRGRPFDSEIHGRYLSLLSKVIKELSVKLEERFLEMPLHSDFTENNILINDGAVSLICDWDNYRHQMFLEHLATSASRFSSSEPLGGVLNIDKLGAFFQNLDDEVLSLIDNKTSFANVFPQLSVLKHLRTYGFRNHLVHKDRPELKERLLLDPLLMCEKTLDDSEELNLTIKHIFN